MKSRRLQEHAPALLVALALVLVAIVRLRVANVPLERDEGEYAYGGQLILRGVPPYVLAYNMKFPGTYYIYALLMACFGQTPWGIHIGLLLVNAATTMMLFLLGRRLVGAWAASAGAALFAVMTLDRWMMGVFAHATHFVILFALAGLWQLHRALETGRTRTFVTAGACLGLAVLMKQPGATFLVLGMMLVIRHYWRGAERALRAAARPIAWLMAGACVPFAALAIVLWTNGTLARFWFWTFEYARAYGSETPLSLALPVLVYAAQYIGRVSWLLWLLSGAGLVLLYFVAWPRETRAWLIGLLVAGGVAASAGFQYRQHYFLLMAPAAALLSGVGLVSIARLAALALPARVARALPVVLALAIVGHYVVQEREYLFSMNRDDLSRSLYASNPFVEAPAIGAYLKEHTAPSDRIGVLGSEPEIFFYAQRTSATGYLYTYSLFEPQPYAARMTAEMTHEIESASPPYLVYVSIGSSWATESQIDNNRSVIAWAKAFVESCYDVVGIADIEAHNTTMVWGADAVGYRPRSRNIVYTLKRKPAGCAAVR